MYYVVGVDLETRFVAGKDMIFVTDAKFMTMMDLNRFKSLKPEFPIIQEARYHKGDVSFDNERDAYSATYKRK